MENAELIARIEKLEAETLVLRRHLRGLISLLPVTVPINGVLADVTRQINVDAQKLDEPMRSNIQSANAAIGAHNVHRWQHLAPK